MLVLFTATADQPHVIIVGGVIIGIIKYNIVKKFLINLLLSIIL